MLSILTTTAKKADSEEQLAQKMRQGDRKAMGEIYSRYAPRLLAICSRYVADRENCRDVLQDSFIKAFTHADSYRPREGATLLSWLSRIVVNESINFLKRNSRLGFIDSEEAIADVAEPDPDTSDIALPLLMEMIEKLPTGYRTVLNLYIFEQKSHGEIARMLNISEGTSASQYSRAKRMLAKQINDYKKLTE